MSHLAKDMTPDVTWKDITPGCNIYEGSTSSVVETGDWRTMKPVIDWDKCRQCLLCAPVCPDMSIPVNGEGKREDFDYFFCKGHHYGQGREIRRGRNNGNQRKTFRQ